MDRFNEGLFDFMVEFEAVSRPDCLSCPLPTLDTWGVLMRADSPLTALPAVRAEDLAAHPVICSRQALKAGVMQAWAGEAFDSWDVVATYNLVFNGALMVEEGLGSAICYDGLVKTVPGGPLCFRPLDPPLSSNIDVVWKKHRRLSKAAETFLGCLQEECG